MLIYLVSWVRRSRFWEVAQRTPATKADCFELPAFQVTLWLCGSRRGCARMEDWFEPESTTCFFCFSANWSCSTFLKHTCPFAECGLRLLKNDNATSFLYTAHDGAPTRRSPLAGFGAFMLSGWYGACLWKAHGVVNFYPRCNKQVNAR